MLETGPCWRPASPPGLTGARGSAPSKLGASGRAAPEPWRPLNESILQSRSRHRARIASSVEIPRRSCSFQGSLCDRARCGANGGEAGLVRGKAQAWGGGGMRGREPGGFPPALPPPTGAENVICCAFQARFPGVTSPSRPGRGEQTKRRGRRRGDPAGRQEGCGGRGQYRERGRIAGPAAAAAPGQWRGAAPGVRLGCRHLNGRRRDAPHSVRPPRTGRPSVQREPCSLSG